MSFEAMTFDPSTSFGPEVAADYDNHPRGDEEVTVARRAALAGEGSALEFAIGTGRIALPLAATGLRVDGVEQSEAMMEQLRAGLQLRERHAGWSREPFVSGRPSHVSVYGR